MDDLIDEFNKEMAVKSKDKIDVNPIKRESATTGITLAAYLVDLSKSETLDAFGEQEAALELAAKHIS